ncbi:hypothetical protein GCM10022225_48080 [Plantactinospora mayteni]|uniref:Uncharacterized protein n=1 Tax=Plantactinospora mayteni TaxID=566021 RepID=A0ABQ4ESP2_9ACTN|nr:hypothetical protein Pma05_42540 [Plantactinospora mayteni]
MEDGYVAQGVDSHPAPHRSPLPHTDLRTAHVELRRADPTGVVETLVVTELVTGIRDEILVKKGNVILPPRQLQAIADAIVEDRQRVVAHKSAFAVADRLRHLASSAEVK